MLIKPKLLDYTLKLRIVLIKQKYLIVVWPFFIPVPAFIISKVLGIVSETVTVSEAIWLIPVTVILYWNNFIVESLSSDKLKFSLTSNKVFTASDSKVIYATV